MAEIVGVEIDCDDDLRAERARSRNRNGIDQRAVHQPAIADLHGREDARQRIGRTDRLDQPAVRQPDLVTGRNFGRDRGEFQRQILDQPPADRLFELRGELAAADQPGAVQLNVEIAQHAARLQAACPVLERIEMAGHIGPADRGADRGADDDVRHDAALEQRAKNADMGKTSGCTAPKHQPDQRAPRGAETDLVLFRTILLALP